MNDYVKLGPVEDEAQSPVLWDKRRDKQVSVQ